MSCEYSKKSHSSPIGISGGEQSCWWVKEEQLPIEAMEERIRELEQQLAKEKMRSTCLDTMIDIAERELKVDIRKKSGAKQSKK